jgi:hypothetical protein
MKVISLFFGVRPHLHTGRPDRHKQKTIKEHEVDSQSRNVTGDLSSHPLRLRALPCSAQRIWSETVMRTLVTVTLGILLLASGLARAQGIVLPLPPDDQQNLTTVLGQGVVGAALPSNPIGDPSVFFPLSERAPTYQVTAGRNAGNTQTLGLAKKRRPGGTSAWRYLLSPTLAGFIRQTPAGDLVMPALSDSSENVVVVTTPANPFIPKGMQPGETRSYSQQVAVNYLDDPTDQRFSGSLTADYTYVGTYQVTVPAGTYSAVLFRVKCHGRVGPADTHNTGYTFFAPGVGVVAIVMQEDVEAFWIYNIDTTSGKVLLSQ